MRITRRHHQPSNRQMKMDWKRMGFSTEAEYTKFLDDKMKSLIDRIKNDPKLLAVFKRLNDR